MNNTFQKKLMFIIPLIALVLIVGFVFSSSFSFAEVLDNGTRVEENSDLTYYIDVLYDGKDSEAVSSSDEATADVYSDYIYVEDKLPEGLTFKEFVSSGGDGIGAVKRNNPNTSCSGSVVGGYNGLSYNPDTNTVSFIFFVCLIVNSALSTNLKDMNYRDKSVLLRQQIRTIQIFKIFSSHSEHYLKCQMVLLLSV